MEKINFFKKIKEVMPEGQMMSIKNIAMAIAHSTPDSNYCPHDVLMAIIDDDCGHFIRATNQEGKPVFQFDHAKYDNDHPPQIIPRRVK